jgi:uncharacterized protein (DUF2147 family)
MGGSKIIAPAFVAVLTIAASGNASASPDPTGIWINDTGRGAIEIKHCGDALCGNVVWVKNAADTNGCGKQIIGGVSPVGNGHWDNGWIYSPERGRKYNVEITPLKNGKLRVTGYAGLKFLSKTMIWTRAPEDLKLCTETIAKAEPPQAASPKSATESTAPAPAAVAPKPNADVAEKPATPKPEEKSATAPTPPASAPDASAKATDTAKSAKAPDTQTAKKKDPPANAAPDNEGATADNNNGDAGDADGGTKSFKLGNLDLGNVLTRTKSGRCKLDLPWVKVQFNCDGD